MNASDIAKAVQDWISEGTKPMSMEEVYKQYPPEQMGMNFGPGNLGGAIAGWMSRTQVAKQLGAGAVPFLKNIPSAAFERMNPENLKVLPEKAMKRLAESLRVQKDRSSLTEGIMLSPENYGSYYNKGGKGPFKKQIQRGEPVMLIKEGTERHPAQIAGHEIEHETSERLNIPYNKQTRPVEEAVARGAEGIQDFTPTELEFMMDLVKGEKLSGTMASSKATAEAARRFEALKQSLQPQIKELLFPYRSNPRESYIRETRPFIRSQQRHKKSVEEVASEIHKK